MATTNQFANVIVDNIFLTIPSGQRTSNILSLAGCQPRALLFPANFITSDVTIQPGLNNVLYNLTNFDATPFVLFGCLPLNWTPLVASMVDAIAGDNCFQIKTSNIQTSSVSIIVLPTSIYHGVHN